METKLFILLCFSAKFALSRNTSLELGQDRDKLTVHSKMESDLQVAFPVGINRRSTVLHSRKSAAHIVGSAELLSENSGHKLPKSEILSNAEHDDSVSDLSANQSRLNAAGDGITEEEATGVDSVCALGTPPYKVNDKSLAKDVHISKSVATLPISGVDEKSSDAGEHETDSEESFRHKGRKRQRSETDISSNTNSGDLGESGENQRQYITRGIVASLNWLLFTIYLV